MTAPEPGRESFFAWADRVTDAEEAERGAAPESGRAAAPTPGQAACDAPVRAAYAAFWNHPGMGETGARFDDEMPGIRAAWEAAIQAAIAAAPDFTEHPACDAHRWYAVVRHCGSFAYGFAASSDGLRVWDDASEFEYAKARDFE